MRNEKPRFVVDTNLLISAALIKNSISQEGVFHILRTGKLVFSPGTYAELNNVLNRPKFDRYICKEKKRKYLALYQSISHFVIPEKHFTHCRDKRDNIFLDAAVAGNAEALITGDHDLLVLGNIEKIPILKMTDFLKNTYHRYR
ncbi:MAG: putative toxin-antitoxin system toxin component, PIN family [Pseudomonadota bacterium]